MKTKSALYALCRAIAEEAESNPKFDASLREALGLDGTSARNDSAVPRRARRAKAPIDPIAVVQEGGEDKLREELGVLTVEQLKDIISEYSMDQDRLAMKWKTGQRLVDRILEISRQRARKGDAFRDSG